MASSRENLRRPLGDAPDRSYSYKLERFSRLIAPELKVAFRELGLPAGSRVLDVGCGVGFATRMLSGLLGPEAHIVGLDLSLPHLQAARGPESVGLVQGDAARLCFRDASFDLIWSCNTINHVAEPVTTLAAMRAALRPRGRVVLAQSALLPEMYFAWDAPLDDAVRRACHEYYRQRYGLTPEDTAEVRGLVGLIRRAGLRLGRVHTVTIERVQPLSEDDRAYFAQTIFEGTWGERLRPYLAPAQWDRLCRNTQRDSADYCLDRDDFHHIQTLTLCVGHA